MEPVRIRCQHCSGRLVIRTPELLGQSVHCPRCQSVIQIPNANNAASTNSWSENNPVLPPSFDSTAVTRVQDSENLSLGNLDAPSSGQSSAPSEVTKSLFDDEQLFPDLNNIPSELLGSEGFIDLPSANEFEQSADSRSQSSANFTASNTLQASENWVSPSTAKKRFVLMVGMTAFVATALALLFFLAFLNSFTNRDVAKAPDNQ